MSDEEKILTKKLRYCEQEYEQDGYLSVGKFEAIKEAVNLIEKQSKEIEEMKKQLDLDNECEIALNSKVMDLEKEIEELKKYEKYYEEMEEVNKKFIAVDKIKEILEIEEKIDNEKLLSLLQTIVDENARLEDIEDRKVQIEYNNVFNKGVKSVEDKIKAKIEEYMHKDFIKMQVVMSHDKEALKIAEVLQSLLPIEKE